MAGSSPEQSTQPEEAQKAERKPKVDSFSEAEELQGSLAHSEQLDKLMRSVLENDKDQIDEGHVLSDGVSQGLQSFTPDLLFDQITKNYKNTKKIFGERFIRELTGYDTSTIEKNSNIPEFKRELQERISQTTKSLQDKGLINKDGSVNDQGISIATLIMITEELESMNNKGLLGKRSGTTKSYSGLKVEYRPFRSSDKYRDLALKQTIKKTLRRKHPTINRDDLTVFEKQDKNRATILYAIDASGSMRGEKLAAAKKAGIALSYKATRNNDLVGCLVFGKEVVAQISPTKDFLRIVKLIATAHAAKETDIAQTMRKAQELLPKHGLRHLIILTDGLQTIGKDPAKNVLDQASVLSKQGISISIVGLQLDKKGEELCRNIVSIGKGTLYLVKDYSELDVLLIEEYYCVARQR